jgi:hypothetical protein
MNAPVNILVPNKADISSHLYALFDPAFVHPYPDAWIEIAYGRPDGPLNAAENFSVFELEKAVEFAVAKNTAGFNIYVGAAIRHGEKPASGRANGDHVLDASHAWVEYDNAGDEKRIWGIVKEKGFIPAFIVTTGITPHPRRHMYFKLSGAVTPDKLKAANESLKVLFGSDDVQNPDRILRLAGTINYPKKAKVENGYIEELTSMPGINKDARAYRADELIGLTGGSTDGFDEYANQRSPGSGRTDADLEKLLKSVNGKDGGTAKWRTPMFAAVNCMIGKGWPDSAIKLTCASYCDAGAEDPDLKELIEDARKKFGKPNIDATNEVIPGSDLPVIEIKDGQLSALATSAEEILIAAGVPLYQRGGILVRPIIETVDASRGRKTNVAQLRMLDAVYMRDLMGRHAIWVKYDGRNKRMNLTNPPPETAATVMARVGEWKFKAIMGVISTPTMRPDGSLLMDQGYDDVTGLLLVEPPPMPAIPDEPTEEDARAALKLLEDLLTGFKFVDGVALSVALSAMISPVVRGAFPVLPMHASRAPTAGSGKSFLFDTVAAIAIGQLMPVMSTGANTEEMEKRLGAAMLAGQPLISIDNISNELGGDALCQIIERPVVEIRILGRSERVRIEARGTSTFATGNNFVVVGDLCRRVLTVNLDTEVERPELRQFKFDPVERVLANRGVYIAAALTICRAYIVAGRPCMAPKLASFEGWSDTVRSALIWLGKADPVQSMENASSLSDLTHYLDNG